MNDKNFSRLFVESKFGPFFPEKDMKFKSSILFMLLLIPLLTVEGVDVIYNAVSVLSNSWIPKTTMKAMQVFKFLNFTSTSLFLFT